MNTIIIFIILAILLVFIFYILYCIYKIENSLKTIINHNNTVLDNSINALNVCKDVLTENKEYRETNNKLYDLCVNLHKEILKNIMFIKTNMVRRKYPIPED